MANQATSQKETKVHLDLSPSCTIYKTAVNHTYHSISTLSSICNVGVITIMLTYFLVGLPEWFFFLDHLSKALWAFKSTISGLVVYIHTNWVVSLDWQHGECGLMQTVKCRFKFFVLMMQKNYGRVLMVCPFPWSWKTFLPQNRGNRILHNFFSFFIQIRKLMLHFLYHVKPHTTKFQLKHR